MHPVFLDIMEPDPVLESIDTGSLETFTSFDQVLESYDKQMAHCCDVMVASINKMDMAHQRLKPLPYLSLLVDD